MSLHYIIVVGEEKQFLKFVAEKNQHTTQTDETIQAHNERMRVFYEMAGFLTRDERFNQIADAVTTHTTIFDNAEDDITQIAIDIDGANAAELDAGKIFINNVLLANPYTVSDRIWDTNRLNILGGAIALERSKKSTKSLEAA